MPRKELTGVGGYGVGPHDRNTLRKLIQSIAKNLPGVRDISDVTLTTNAHTDQDVIDIVNNGNEPPASESVLGKTIPAGSVGIIMKEGVLYAVGRGTWLLPNPRASWQDVINVNSVSHVNVAGLLSIVRPARTDYALCMNGNAPVIVDPSQGGFYVSTDTFFSFERFVPIASKTFQHFVLTFIRVGKGEFAKVTCEGVPALLPTGTFLFEKDDLVFDGYASIRGEDTIVHRTITYFDVRAGTYALGWVDNEHICFKEPGVYLVDTLGFEFERCVDIEDSVIRHGTMLIIRVDEGYVALISDHGQLRQLPADTYEFNDVHVLFLGLFSTKQESVDLGGKGANRAQTAELVELSIVATAFYRVLDVTKMLRTVGTMEQAARFIDEYCSCALTNAFRRASVFELSDKGRGGGGGKGRHRGRRGKSRVGTTTAAAAADDDGDGEQLEGVNLVASRSVASEGGGDPAAALGQDDKEKSPSASSSGDEESDLALPFLDRISNEVHRELHVFVRKMYGIELLRVRVSDVKVMSEQLRELLAAQTMTSADIQSQLRNMQDTRRVTEDRAESSANNDRRKVESDCSRLMTAARAEARSMRDSTFAQAAALELEVQATAHADKLLAAAEAERMRLTALADAERVKAIEATPFGPTLTLAKLRTNAFRETMEGVTDYVSFMHGEGEGPCAMVFNPGDAVPVAGTWNGEELQLAAERQRREAHGVGGGGGGEGATTAVRAAAAHTTTILRVPGQAACEAAFAHVAGPRPRHHTDRVPTIPERSGLVDVLCQLFPRLQVAEFQPGLDALAREWGATVYPVSWKGLQPVLSFIAHHFNINSMHRRFHHTADQEPTHRSDSAATAAAAAGDDDETAEDASIIRLGKDDLAAANTLLGIRVDLLSVYTELGGFRRGYVTAAHVASWMVRAPEDALEDKQPPFDLLLFDPPVPPQKPSQPVTAAPKSKPLPPPPQAQEDEEGFAADLFNPTPLRQRHPSRSPQRHQQKQSKKGRGRFRG